PCPRRRRPPPSPPLPYTTLFRSGRDGADQPPAAEHDASAGALSPEDGAGARSAATATDGSVSADPVGSAGTSASPASAPSADSAPSAGSAPSAETPSAETPVEPPSTTPAVWLEGLGLRGSRGWAFRAVDLVAQPGDLVVITGASGTGGSPLLLAIAGRLQPTAGSLEAAGCTVAGDRRNHRALKRARERVAVARLADHICLDGNLSV